MYFRQVLSCVFILLAFSPFQHLSAQEAVRVLIESEDYRSPMIRGISNDGKYLAETAIDVNRNAEADVQFGTVPRSKQIAGPFWLGARLWPIHDVKSGKIALMLSQLIKDPKQDNPFRSELKPGFEKSLFDSVQEKIVLRFPTVTDQGSRGSHGRITNFWFGSPGSLMVLAVDEKARLNRLGRIAIKTKELDDLGAEDIMGPESIGTLGETFFDDGSGFLNTSELRIHRYTKNGEQRSAIPALADNLSRIARQPVTLGPDQDCWLAAYDEGLILWDLGGMKKIKTVVFNREQFPPDNKKHRYVAMLSQDQAIVFTAVDYTRGDAYLLDLNTGKVLDSVGMETIVPYMGSSSRLHIADSGKYVCFRAMEKGSQLNDELAFCFKVEGSKIKGPWRIDDPDSRLPLRNVHNIVCASKAPVLAVETKETASSSPGAKKQRILLVDLEALTANRE